MQLLSSSVSALLALALVPARPAPGEDRPAEEVRVRFAPAEGSTLVKRFEWGSTQTIEEFALDLSGQVFDQGVGLTREVAHVLAVEDTYAAVDAGRPTDLRRRYLEVARTLEANDPSEDGSVHVAGLGRTTSELQGHRARFRWDAEAEAYERSWAEDDPGGAVAEWLEPLAVDLDLRAFLPPADEGLVEVGVTWEVDVSAVRDLLRPGGDLRLEPRPEDEDARDEGIQLEIPSLPLGTHLGELEGSVSCQLLALEEEEGLREAVLRLRVEVTSVEDLAGALAEEDPDGQVYDRVERELTLFGEGDLRWNLSADHLVALDFEAEVTQRVDAEWTLDAQGVEAEVQLTSASRGRAWLRCRLE